MNDGSDPGPRVAALQIQRQGHGPPIVLTHGYGADSSTWSHQVPALQAVGTTVTWDLRGHGRTPEPDDGRYDQEAALADLLSVLGPRRSVLVGHSFGGYLSLWLAITRPELVRALVLIATGPGFRNDRSREAWNTFARRAGAKMDPPIEAAEMLIQRDGFVIDNLDQITVPVLHIVGAEDTQFHAGHAVLQANLPDARAAVIDGARHLPHVEASPAVNAALLAFLSRLPPLG